MALRVFVLQTPTYQPAALPLSLRDEYGYTTLMPRYRHLYENSTLFADQDEILMIIHQFAAFQKCTVRVTDFQHNRILIDTCLKCSANSYHLSLNLTNFDLKGSQKLRFDIIVHDDSTVIKTQQLNVRLQNSVEAASTPYQNFIAVSMKQLIDQPILYEQKPYAGKFPDLEAFGMGQQDVVTRAFRRLDRPALAIIEPRTSFQEALRKHKIEFAAKAAQRIIACKAGQFCEIPLENVKLLNWRTENVETGVSYVDFVDNKLIVFCVLQGVYQLKWVEIVQNDGQKALLSNVSIKVE